MARNSVMFSDLPHASKIVRANCASGDLSNRTIKLWMNANDTRILTDSEYTDISTWYSGLVVYFSAD